jgi:Fic family protein
MQFNLILNSDDAEIKSNLGLLDDLRYVIRSLVPSGYESYFQEQALYSNAHSSTAIEGNPLDDDAAMLVLVDATESEDPDEIEKLNLREAYQFIAQLGADKTTWIDTGLIRALNSGTLRGLPDEKARNRGRFRVGQNLIVDGDTREVRYRTPPPEFVSELMEDFERKVDSWKGDLPGPLAAALAHFALISIHPFDDGNGRTARLVADLLLHLTGWSIDGMLSLNRVLWEKRAEYYEVLRSTQGPRFVEDLNVTDFVRFHTQVLNVAAARLHSQVASFLRRRDELTRELDFLSPRQVMAIMFIWDIGALSSTRMAKLTKVSQPTALSDLTEMVKRGIAIREGAGPTTRYHFNPELIPASAASDDTATSTADAV